MKYFLIKMNADLKIFCALPPNCQKKLIQGEEAFNPPFSSAALLATQSVPTETPIIWDTVLEDSNMQYDSATGIMTIVKSGIWLISGRVTINQTGMTNFPSSFYQHIFVLWKSTPFPESTANVRFVDVLQERLAAPGITRQIVLSFNENVRLKQGETVQFRLITVTFSPTSGIVNTNIGGVVCLNCMSALWSGN